MQHRGIEGYYRVDPRLCGNPKNTQGKLKVVYPYSSYLNVPCMQSLEPGLQAPAT